MSGGCKRSVQLAFCLLAMLMTAIAHASTLPSSTLPPLKLPPLKLPKITALCYHDVRDVVDGRLDADQTAISTRHLAEHFAWLQRNGYTSVTLTQVDDAVAGRSSLPAKPLLLSFDDGSASAYTHVLPLLKLYGFHAVMALEGNWLAAPAAGKVVYGDVQMPREYFLSAAQIREMQASGLIEFASHSFDLHRGVLANPQGNEQPSAVTLQYDAAQHRYETPDDLRQRIHSDLQRSRQQLQQLMGVLPQTLAWPFGQWSELAEQQARSLGFRHFLLLGDDAQMNPSAGRIARRLVVGNPDVAGLRALLAPPAQMPAVRAAQVRLDDLRGPSEAETVEHIDRLLDRIKTLRISAVYLEALSAGANQSNPEATYFPASQMPLRADLFNRVAWQLSRRAGVRVYAVMPLEGFVVEGRALRANDAADQDRIVRLWRDLFAHAAVAGVITPVNHLASAETLWPRLQAAVREFRPEAVFLWQLPMADVVRDRQVMPRVLQSTDRVVLLQPAASAPDVQLTRQLQEQPALAERVIIELLPQAGDNLQDNSVFAQQLRYWQMAGLQHFAWYPDNVVKNTPPGDALFRLLSLEDYPYKRK